MTECQRPNVPREDDVHRFSFRDLAVLAALLMSVLTVLFNIGGGWGVQKNVIEYHERRITNLEQWQGGTVQMLHTLDKKVDLLLQNQKQFGH